MKCMRVLRRVTSGAFRYSSANSRARLSAVPFDTTSATTLHSYVICGLRRERLWVEQERLRSSCSSAITPCGKDSVTRHNARGEVRHILEGRTLGRHNHIGK